MDWILLIIAGLCETGFATCLGKANENSGLSKWWWMFGFLSFLCLSMYLLYEVSKRIPIGTAYAVWTGIGAVGAVLVGIFMFDEPANFWRIFFLFTLIVSIIGIKVLGH